MLYRRGGLLPEICFICSLYHRSSFSFSGSLLRSVGRLLGLGSYRQSIRQAPPSMLLQRVELLLNFEHQQISSTIVLCTALSILHDIASIGYRCRALAVCLCRCLARQKQPERLQFEAWQVPWTSLSTVQAV
jgi:hypothetical protein